MMGPGAWGVGRGAWSVGRGAWGVGRGARGVERGARGVGRGGWGVGRRAWRVWGVEDGGTAVMLIYFAPIFLLFFLLFRECSIINAIHYTSVEPFGREHYQYGEQSSSRGPSNWIILTQCECVHLNCAYLPCALGVMPISSSAVNRRNLLTTSA